MKLTKNHIFFIISANLWGFCYFFWNMCIFPCFWRWYMGFLDQQKSWLVPLNCYLRVSQLKLTGGSKPICWVSWQATVLKTIDFFHSESKSRTVYITFDTQEGSLKEAHQKWKHFENKMDENVAIGYIFIFYVINSTKFNKCTLSCDKGYQWQVYLFLAVAVPAFWGGGGREHFQERASTASHHVFQTSQFHVDLNVIHTLRVHYAHAAANLNSRYSKYTKVARVHYFCTIALRTSRAVLTRV